MIADANPDPAAFTPAVAVAILQDGREAQVEVSAQLGSPADPLTEAQHLAKARACLAFAGLADRHERLAALMARFAEADDVGGAVAELLRR